MNNAELLVALMSMYCDHIEDWGYETNAKAKGFFEQVINDLIFKIGAN